MPFNQGFYAKFILNPWVVLFYPLKEITILFQMISKYCEKRKNTVFFENIKTQFTVFHEFCGFFCFFCTLESGIIDSTGTFINFYEFFPPILFYSNRYVYCFLHFNPNGLVGNWNKWYYNKVFHLYASKGLLMKVKTRDVKQNRIWIRSFKKNSS